MSKSPKISRRPRILLYLMFLSVIAAVVIGLAQTPEKVSGRVLVDGRLHPDQVPDWILWNQVFTMAAYMNEKSPSHGQELWTDRLHLTKQVMDEVVSHGYEQLEMANDVFKETGDLVSDSRKARPEKIDHPDRKEGLRIQLKKSQLNMEARTLEIRDKLRRRIGDDAYLRLESYARLQIAPTIKIGN